MVGLSALRMRRVATTTAAGALLVTSACSVLPMPVPIPVPVPWSKASQAPATSGTFTAAGWRPKNPIDLPPPTTDAQDAAARAENLQALAKLDELPHPPRVRLIRWTTIDTYDATMATCLNDAGFTTTEPAPGGGLSYGTNGIDETQAKAYNTAEYVCAARFSLKPKYATDWTPSQLGLVYDYDYEALAPCLRERGYAVPPAPSREDFIRDFFSPNTSRWDPYAAISPPEPLNLQQELYDSCPPRPLSHDLYGYA